MGGILPPNFFASIGNIMSIKLLLFRNSVYSLLTRFMLIPNICFASEADLDSAQHTPSSPLTPLESHARFHADPALVDAPNNDETPTEIGRQALPNSTFAARPTTYTSIEESLKDSEKEDDGFISVEKQAKIKATIQIVGGMFDTLTLPHSTMPYTEIELSHCTCFNPLDQSTFQNNPELSSITLRNSHLNLRNFVENLGEKCTSLIHIDLQGFVDVSATEQPIITPERLAQIAHPDLLQRILRGVCTVFISHPDRQTECYTLEEMKEPFLSSILHLRSLTKAKETLSTYQRLIDMLTAGVSKLEPTQLAAAGGRVLLGVYTGF